MDGEALQQEADAEALEEPDEEAPLTGQTMPLFRKGASIRRALKDVR